MDMRPNGPPGAQENKQPPQQASTALAQVETGGERIVKLNRKRQHFESLPLPNIC
jgi:hypothetical protein